jgi:hypothetical protein
MGGHPTPWDRTGGARIHGSPSDPLVPESSWGRPRRGRPEVLVDGAGRTPMRPGGRAARRIAKTANPGDASLTGCAVRSSPAAADRSPPAGTPCWAGEHQPPVPSTQSPLSRSQGSAGTSQSMSGSTSDQVVNQLSPRDRDIAMVFQSYALYPHMTVRENMAFSLKLAHVERAEIDRKVHQAAELLVTGGRRVRLLPPPGGQGHRPGTGGAGRRRRHRRRPRRQRPDRGPPRPGQPGPRRQQLRLWFDPGKLHLFNPKNGAHLTL